MAHIFVLELPRESTEDIGRFCGEGSQAVAHPHPWKALLLFKQGFSSLSDTEISSLTTQDHYCLPQHTQA